MHIIYIYLFLLISVIGINTVSQFLKLVSNGLHVCLEIPTARSRDCTDEYGKSRQVANPWREI